MSGERPPAAASFFVGRGGFQHKGELGPWSGWILSYGRLGHDFDLGDACSTLTVTGSDAVAAGVTSADD